MSDNTPIQDAVAWLRLEIANQRTLWADAIEAQGREIERMREALGPFATFGQSDDGDIRDGLMRDRICDWFGPSDFDATRAALAQHTTPTGAQPTADRDAALATTHLPAGAPPLGAPAPLLAALKAARDLIILERDNHIYARAGRATAHPAAGLHDARIAELDAVLDQIDVATGAQLPGPRGNNGSYQRG